MDAENRKSRKKKITIVLAILIISGGIITLLLYVLGGSKEYIGEPIDDGPKYDEWMPPEYEKIELSSFPISLYHWFWKDNSTVENQYLNRVREYGISTSYLFSYPCYYHGAHHPAALKWYTYQGRHLRFSLPIDSYLIFNGDTIDGLTELIINGTNTKSCSVFLKLSYYISFQVDYIQINSSLLDQWEATEPFKFLGQAQTEKAVFIPANTSIGYTSKTGITLHTKDLDHTNYPGYAPLSPELDNTNKMKNHNVNPFFYFNEATQKEILFYFNDTYNALIESGYEFQSKINRTYDINEENSFFGAWYYDSGWFVLNESHHQLDWYSFDGGSLTIMNLNKTDRESFRRYKNYDNIPINISSEVLGLYGDAGYGVAPEGYDYLNLRVMYYEEGNNATEGIIRLEELRPYVPKRTGVWYVKYQVIEGDSSTMWDDKLDVEYFETLPEAQGSFTPEKLTYCRMTLANA